jgi:hypothetical protein
VCLSTCGVIFLAPRRRAQLGGGRGVFGEALLERVAPEWPALAGQE